MQANTQTKRDRHTNRQTMPDIMLVYFFVVTCSDKMGDFLRLSHKHNPLDLNAMLVPAVKEQHLPRPLFHITLAVGGIKNDASRLNYISRFGLGGFSLRTITAYATYRRTYI